MTDTKIRASRRRTTISNRKGLSDEEILGSLFGVFDLPPKTKVDVPKEQTQGEQKH